MEDYTFLLGIVCLLRLPSDHLASLTKRATEGFVLVPEPNVLLRRMRLHVLEEVDARRLPKGAFPILREALLAGAVPRGRAAEITGYGERMARNVVSDLLKKG